ncbi:MAG: 23S rRNA (adenine(2503)-C(2))-methyltransferase RlmN [Desulfobacteraceae bacterium]
MNLLGLTYPQLVSLFRDKYGRGEFHAAALYRGFYGSSIQEPTDNEAFSNSKALRRRLRSDLEIAHPTQVAQATQDGVTKLVFRLCDGNTIETVIIPMANHATVCVSSQVGCRMGCRFCRTGQLGWIRHMNAAEIVSQVYAVKVAMGMDVRNVVFMGMGEPLDNFDQVVQAIRVMEDQRGLNIAKSRITLSTVGLPHRIGQLAGLNWPQLKLALSLNAPNDVLRSELMPVNRRYPLEQLKKSLAVYPLGRGNTIFMEYVLIKGINDNPTYAQQLRKFIGDLPVKLNLIPYNPGPGSAFQAPDDKDVERFHRALIDQAIFVRVRVSKGAGIMAACGQLGGVRPEAGSSPKRKTTKYRPVTPAD